MAWKTAFRSNNRRFWGEYAPIGLRLSYRIWMWPKGKPGILDMLVLLVKWKIAGTRWERFWHGLSYTMFLLLTWFKPMPFNMHKHGMQRSLNSHHSWIHMPSRNGMYKMARHDPHQPLVHGFSSHLVALARNSATETPTKSRSYGRLMQPSPAKKTER